MAIGRTTKTITISIPREMDAQIKELMRVKGRTRSELLREALRCYMREREWRELVRYGQGQAHDAGITEEELEDVVNGFRG